MQKTFIAILLTVVLFYKPAQLYAQSANITDSLALVNLYDSTGGPNWVTSTNWLTAPVSKWFGVVLDGDGRVTSINFENRQGYSNNLTGTLPLTLGNLAHLQFLYLDDNNLHGSIPSTLGNLSNLQILHVSSDGLTDSIPSSLGNLTSLKTLYLTDNKLTGNIPTSLGNLTNLQNLDLSYNSLAGNLPSTIGNLFNLQVLNVSYNQLYGNVPSSITGLYQLTQIKLNNNAFTFSGMEDIVKTFYYANYTPQASIPVHVTGLKLSVSAGGTLTNNTYQWYKDNQLISTITGDSVIRAISPGKYRVSVANNIATKLTLLSNTVSIYGDSVVLPAQPNTKFANYEYTDSLGWTNYYYNNNTPNDLSDDTLLLSLKKNGQYIGTVGDGTFSLKLVATAGAGSNTGLLLTNPLITNASGYWVMNRYWQVTPTQEPTKDVGVRFYYTNQDLADVNGSYPTHNLTNNNLIFYKTVGGNPDPTTNLAGASSIISILPGTQATDTTWTFHSISDTSQYGEYSVAGFSGGGGGGTGNNLALPVTLINFTGQQTHEGNLLQWQTATEINSDKFNLQRSVDATHFSTIVSISAAGNSNSQKSYSYTDALAGLNPVQGVLFYRLQIADKNGLINYSKIISIKNDGLSPRQLKIYPNPAHDIITAELSGLVGGLADITITDAAGKIIDKQHLIVGNGQSVNINIHGLAPGIYFFCAYYNKQNFKQKFVKQ